MKGMILNCREDVPFFAFPAFVETKLIGHGFSTRQGGVSAYEYATMNLSFAMGDSKEHVRENYRRMAMALETSLSTMTSVWQAHTDKVKTVTAADRGKGILLPKDPEPFDAMITNEKNVTLTTLHGDCLPLYFLDPIKKAIGLAHSGWRGTQQEIGIRTLEKMEAVFGTKREEVLIGIGPGIGREVFEVGSDVADAFEVLLGRNDAKEVLNPQLHEKYLLDLPYTNELLFRRAGIPSHHIFTANLCTYTNSDLFFSHRRDGNRRGSMAAFLVLC